jgi:putative mRNA 3-end processing factor
MVRWLCDQGLDAQVFATEYGADDNEDDTAAAPEVASSAPPTETAP